MVLVATKPVAEYDPKKALTTAKHLSDFQVAKLSFFFENIFDADKNGRLELEDLIGIGERISKYNGWTMDSPQAEKVVDVHKIFFECLADQTRAEIAAADADEKVIPWEEALNIKTTDDNKISVSLTQWLNMWGRLSFGSAGLSDFPVWVQLLPKIYFQVVDQDKDGYITKHELRNFYEKFVGVEKGELDKVTEEGYRVMTANGDYQLDLEQYCFVFANFLLGKSKYGPGKYLFGCFDNSEINETYSILYNEEDPEQ